jgi:hypothetical protein
MTVTTLILATGVTLAGTAGEEPFAQYEQIRQALLFDTTEGVAEQAGAIVRWAENGAADRGTEAGGVCDAGASECGTIMDEISTAAVRLGSAGSLDASRQAFGELSRAMVKLRGTLGEGPKPVVAYCSMADKVWLQPKGELGNPYYGQSMATCGEIVSE